MTDGTDVGCIVGVADGTDVGAAVGMTGGADDGAADSKDCILSVTF